MTLELTQEAADRALGSLLEWGIGGAILAVFVAPAFLLMVRGAQKREDARLEREEAEATRRAEREDKLVEMLRAALELQRHAHENLAAQQSSRALIDGKLVAAFDASVAAMSEVATSIREGRELTRHAAASLAEISRSLKLLQNGTA